MKALLMGNLHFRTLKKGAISCMDGNIIKIQWTLTYIKQKILSKQIRRPWGIWPATQKQITTSEKLIPNSRRLSKEQRLSKLTYLRITLLMDSRLREKILSNLLLLTNTDNLINFQGIQCTNQQLTTNPERRNLCLAIL